MRVVTGLMKKFQQSVHDQHAHAAEGHYVDGEPGDVHNHNLDGEKQDGVVPEI